MKNCLRNSCLAVAYLVALHLLFGSVLATGAENDLPYYDTPEFTPRWLGETEELAEFHRIPDFSFTNQEGKQVTQDDVAGRVYVASFFFSTCPGICPAIRTKLAAVQEHFIDDDAVLILAHSIRPSADTVEILQAYATANDVQTDKWHLLTGRMEDIYRLAKDAYFADENLGEIRGADDFLHTENLLLIDKNRYIRGIYNGLSTSSVDHLIADIETLLSGENIAAPGR